LNRPDVDVRLRFGGKVLLALLVMLAAAPAAAQDIRGLEVCSAEKDMARRTGCLQGNVEFLQKELARQARDARARDAASARDIAALKTDIASLRAALVKLEGELADVRKAKPQVGTEKKKPE
jgi:hypothetical protein